MQKGVNKVILLGNLGKEPEVRYMPNGQAVANVSIATSETWKDKNTGEQREKTEWHRLIFFRRLAEICGEYLRKGSKIYIEGKLQTRKYQDKASGQDRYITEVVVDSMQMLDSFGGGKVSQNQPVPDDQMQDELAQGEETANNNEGFDDDIPF